MKKPEYCINNCVKSCDECCYVNYGLDCHNNHVVEGYEDNGRYYFDTAEEAREACEEYRQQQVEQFYDWSRNDKRAADYLEMSYEEIDKDFVISSNLSDTEFEVSCDRCGDNSGVTAHFYVKEAEDEDAE